MFDFLEETTDRSKNRFADAYIIPTRTAVNTLTINTHTNLPASSHLPGIALLDDHVSWPGVTHRNTMLLQRNDFWVVYVASAYQMIRERSFDRDDWVNGAIDDVPESQRPVLGFTLDEPNTRNVSYVLLETVRDAWHTATAMQQEEFYPANWKEYMGRTTIHELGHQFFLEHVGGIMARDTSRVKLEDFYFVPVDLRDIRQVVGPGLAAGASQ